MRPSFGTNLPQIVTHIWQKAFFKHALGIRTAETVSIYFTKSNSPLIRQTLPQKAKTLEEAIRDYKATLLPDAASYGKTILARGIYIGDIWCYGIHPGETPSAMVSYCIFEPDYWRKGIATEAMRLFLQEIVPRYRLDTIGAFTYSDNIPSIRVLEKNHFVMTEEFAEHGISSRYYEYSASIPS